MTTKPEYQKLSIGETEYETTFTRKFTERKHYVAPDPNNILCIIPGVIQKVHVKAGQKVLKGDPLCVLEAMKMQNDIRCPFDARVRSVQVEAGTMVAKGDLLLELE
jgi:biotin carboxyl carrier protein